MKRFTVKRLVLLLPLPLALLLRLAASVRPEWTERLFSTGIYPKIAAPASRLMAICPFPVVEIGIVIFFLSMLYLLFKKRFFAVLASLCLVAAVFFGGWSLNYFRFPLEKTLDIPVQASTAEELAALCDKLAAEANAYYGAPPEQPLTGVTGAMNAAGETWPIPIGRFASPKVALTSGVLSRFLVEGITSPFTAEALVNGGIPALSLPFVGCHEAAHVRGFAREEDANLIAYLACTASDDPYFRYSGAVSALLHCLSALQNADPDAYTVCRAKLSDGVREDIAAHAAYWAQYRGTPAAEVGARVNDAYLRTAGSGDQSARSYGRVVDLLLAIERKEKP